MKPGFLQADRPKTILAGLVLLSLVVGVFCISLIHPALAHSDTKVVHHASHMAVLTGCCDINTADHVESWKSTLMGIPQAFQDVLVLVAIGFAAVFVLSDLFARHRLTTTLLFLRYRQYVREHPNIKAFDVLRLALAKGILNPKTH